jgi:hypothetical protein
VSRDTRHYVTLTKPTVMYAGRQLYRDVKVACGAKNWEHTAEVASETDCKSCRRSRAWKDAHAVEAAAAEATIATFVEEIWDGLDDQPELRCEYGKAIRHVMEYGIDRYWLPEGKLS